MNFYFFAKDKIERSLRLELMVSFAICILAAFVVGSWYNGYYIQNHLETEVDYSSSINNITNEYYYVKNKIEDENISIKNNDAIDAIIADAYNSNKDNVKLYLTDINGNVLYKTKNANDKNLNLFDYIKKAAQFRKDEQDAIVTYTSNNTYKQRIVFDKQENYVSLDGVDFSDAHAILVITGIPKGNTIYIEPQGSIFSLLQGVVAFIGLFYFLTSKKMRYIEKISEGLFKISQNKLDYKIKIEGKDELASLSENINFMTQELNNISEKEKNAEKSKRDLVTNVSHDLRTPLTSIKGYIGLLKDKKYNNEKELMDYLNIAYNKAEKLEILINDLFEYNKLSNKGVSLQFYKSSITELLDQLIEELYVICLENNVKIVKFMPQEEIWANIDGDKIARVFENLLINAIRYSIKPGEIKLRIKTFDSKFQVSVENKCYNISKDHLSKIFERFYRVDKSRAEGSGGSGLGLAISKSIIELHGGRIWAEVKDDNIIFITELNINGGKADDIN